MGSSGSAGGGRAARVLRLLLLLILALAAVEYLCGSILDASPIRTYLYTPLYNATQPTIRYTERLHSNSHKRSSKIKPNPQLKHNSTNITTTPRNKKDITTTPRNKKAISTTPRNKKAITTTPVPSSKNPNKITDITKQIVNMTIQDFDNSSLLISAIVKSIKNPLSNDSSIDNELSLPLCDAMPPDLGPIKVNKTDLELEWVEKLYPEIQWGGRYTPPNCTARHKVAIIVPYRDRKQHLAIFLNHMHPFLMKQQIEYGIFVIEQKGNKDFNRAKLMNVGFVESQKLAPGGWQCFIFHDIDLLPLDTRNMYSCPRQPRHMSASIDKLHFKLPYEDIFGGVSAVTREQFLKVNGFSNKYWGWGGEDDDMFYRLKKMNYHIARYKMSIARYAMLDHKKSSPNPKRYQLLSQTSKTFPKDGLSTLTYELIQVVQYHLYTHIVANIDERS